MKANTHNGGSVSVIIPLYNHEHYVGHALESVFAQSMQPLEIIVVDDGSCDGSVAMVHALAAQRPEIVFWSHPNQGAHYTLNAAIHRARGEFVSILNSDDAYHPERLAHCLQVFREDPGVAVVTTALNFVDEQGAPIRNRWHERAKAFYQEIGDLSLALVNGNFLMTTSNICARRSLFHDIGGFAGLRYAHDLEFFLRVLARGKRIHFLDKPLVDYRRHASNTIREDVPKVRVETAGAVAYFIYEYWHKWPGGNRDWGYLGRITDITDRLGLTPLLVHFLAFFRDVPPGDDVWCAFARDEGFRESVERTARASAAGPSPPSTRLAGVA
ncbi:MAG: glycosyltransferase family 2 protein [Gammaproteobacteria bacterium]